MFGKVKRPVATPGSVKSLYVKDELFKEGKPKIIGGWVSMTLMRKLQLSRFPVWSTAVYVTEDDPRGKDEFVRKFSGKELTVITALPELSTAVTVGRVTKAVGLPGSQTLGMGVSASVLQPERTGASRSETVATIKQTAGFPAASLAVMVMITPGPYVIGIGVEQLYPEGVDVYATEVTPILSVAVKLGQRLEMSAVLRPAVVTVLMSDVPQPDRTGGELSTTVMEKLQGTALFPAKSVAAIEKETTPTGKGVVMAVPRAGQEPLIGPDVQTP